MRKWSPADECTETEHAYKDRDTSVQELRDVKIPFDATLGRGLAFVPDPKLKNSQIVRQCMRDCELVDT
jgi:hypothetical protein